MNIEPDIFDYLETTSLEPHDDYTSEITYKDQKIIWNRLKEKDKEIEILSKEVDMWNKKYNEQFDIINELEKWLNDWKSWIDRPDEFEDGIISCINDTLYKIKELKEAINSEKN